MEIVRADLVEVLKSVDNVSVKVPPIQLSTELIVVEGFINFSDAHSAKVIVRTEVGARNRRDVALFGVILRHVMEEAEGFLTTAFYVEVWVAVWD